MALAVLSRIISFFLSNYNLKKHETTVGQITGLLVQINMCFWAMKVVLEHGHRDTMGDISQILLLGVGYYIYDMIHMMTYESGKYLVLFQLHHIGTIVIFIHTYLYLDDIVHPYQFGAVIIPLELTSASLNIAILCKLFIQRFEEEIEFINMLFYGFSRIFMLPILTILSIYSNYPQEKIREMYHFKYMLPICMLSVLYALSVNWFKTMVYKYYNKRIATA
jgi:hypothetical protein